MDKKSFWHEFWNWEADHCHENIIPKMSSSPDNSIAEEVVANSSAEEKHERECIDALSPNPTVHLANALSSAATDVALDPRGARPNEAKSDELSRTNIVSIGVGIPVTSPPKAGEDKADGVVFDGDVPDRVCCVGGGVVVEGASNDCSGKNISSSVTKYPMEAATSKSGEHPPISDNLGKQHTGEDREEIDFDDFQERTANIADADDFLMETEVGNSSTENADEEWTMKVNPTDDTSRSALEEYLETPSILAATDSAGNKIVSETAVVSPGNPKVDKRPKAQIYEHENSEHECIELDDDSTCAFESLVKQRRKQRRRMNYCREKLKPIRISVPLREPEQKGMEAKTKGHLICVNNKDELINRLCPIDDVSLKEEDPLSFYSNLHEGEDPDCAELQSSMMKNRVENELTKLKKAKKIDMKKIQAYLTARWEERNDNLQRQINKIRFDMVSKQTQQRTQLAEKQNRQTEADDRKLAAGENWLVQKQQMEMQQTMAQHQNLATADIMKLNAIVNQLQSRHAFQRQQFEEKKIEMKKRLDQELKAQNQSIQTHHEKRQAEAETQIKELAEKCREQHEKLKVKLTRLHEERFETKRKQIICVHPAKKQSESETSSQGDTPTANSSNFEKTAELNVDNQSSKGWMQCSVLNDAVVRQKQRKGLMNNINIQLAIEIHNEGIITITRSNQTPPANGRSSKFIPWGRLSASFLYSIVLGEVPSSRLMNQIGCAELGSLGGGLVKCVITDTRTSEQNAISERASILAQVQDAKSGAHLKAIDDRYSKACATMSALQAECTNLIENVGGMSSAHKEATLQLENATQTLEKFKTQAQHFFNLGK